MTTNSILSKVLKENPIAAADIGAHGGVPSYWKDFQHMMEIDAFEPNQTECLKQQKLAPENIHWHPVGLAGTTGRQKFYVPKKTTGASLYKPNEDLFKYFGDPNYWGEIAETEIECLTYSDFLSKTGRPTPHLLKLDTQGSELDIIKSLGPHLNQVLAIEAEIEFIPLYNDQPLFSDIESFMTKNGFELFDLRTARMYLTNNKSQNYYIKRHLNTGVGTPNLSSRLVAGDALYFKSPDHPEIYKSKETFIRYIGLLVIYRFFDLAFWMLEEKSSKILEKEDASSLIQEVKKLAPKPKLSQRSDLLGKVARKVFSKIGLPQTYKAFWVERVWPNQ